MVYKNMEIHNCYDIVTDPYSGLEKTVRVPEEVRTNLSPIGRQLYR